LGRGASDAQQIHDERDQEKESRHHDAPCLRWAATE
jgi:hypothetical protein